MTGTRIAITGIACRYPDAESPAALWENILAGRRAFRRIPDERMRLEDYWSPDPLAPDRFYSQKAAVLEGWEFDRTRFRIAGSTYRSTDMTHWLALDTVDRALADAGFEAGQGLPRETTAVIVGNTLTGEFSRANLLRLRWPYVRRAVAATLRGRDWDDTAIGEILGELEARYKSPFPPVDEDTLAGGLANTIAGRICNHYDFKGGGFTVDGACSSSLLAVSSACQALADGQIDAAVVGGVDLSIDPFEIIGFAKTGALATADMRVYDRHSNGFWPGEGCGMLVLLREDDAKTQDLRSYALIAGWGYSSDGKGGITRPEEAGHRLAIERAYRRTGFGIGSVGYLEGHGTGTAVGDATELHAFSEARRADGGADSPAAISTIKGNIGHTKAAAGVAGLIKATLAVYHQIIPPATGHHEQHPELAGERPALRVPAAAELWPSDRPVRAGVSSMGFGGINAHIVVQSAAGKRRRHVDACNEALVRSRQDCELLLLDAASSAELRGRAARLAEMAPRLSFAELGDLAGSLQRELSDQPIRAAVVAAAPEEAERGFAKLLNLLDDGAHHAHDIAAGVFLGVASPPTRIGYLFPGQGSGRRGDGGALRRRFELVDELYRSVPRPAGADLVETAVAQPRIVTSSVAALRVLSLLGLDAVASAGHSLGELTSLYWAEAMDEAALLRLAGVRGKVMSQAGHGGGAMASITAGPDAVEPLLAGGPVVIAGLNSPRQTVISGPADAVDRVCRHATRAGFATGRISVSHAFHSPAMAPAANALRTLLGDEHFQPLRRRVVSTVTGDVLPSGTDLRDLLVTQVLDPVRFAEAVGRMRDDVDLLIEVGPGRVLTGLAADIVPSVPAVAVDADSVSLSGLLRAVAAAYVLGAPVKHAELFAGRLIRPMPLDKEFRFLASPCESAPVIDIDVVAKAGGAQDSNGHPTAGGQSAQSTDQDAAGQDSLEILRALAAERAELPLDAIRPDMQPLDELHLSSITVGQIVNQAAQRLGLAPPTATSMFATSTLAELSQMLDGLASTELPADATGSRVQGVAPWVRAFTVDLVPAPSRQPGGPDTEGGWRVFAPPGHTLAGPLGEALRQAKLGDGVLLCLPADCDDRHIGLLLDAAHAALAAGGASRFVVVQDARGAAGLAKTLHLEAPSVATSLITLPLGYEMDQGTAAACVAGIVADVTATSSFSEIVYDGDGTRHTPVLRVWDPADGASDRLPLGDGDVLLVTGGGKGITAECALMLAAQTGASVGLLGRSDPAGDKELSENLERLEAAGVSFRYVRADVTSAGDVKAAVSEIRRTLGPVTAVLHGAGTNEPVGLASLDEATFRRALAPKVNGLELVLAAADPASLKLLVTFGSIIGRAGLRGEAHYSTANDWLTHLTSRVRREYPQCRCVALEWSVWSGTGMGERLGVLESLIREGIDPIPVDEGVAMLRDVLAHPDPPGVLVVMGRAEGMPTIRLDQPDVPLLRFTDQPRVHYPGIELVADAELSAGSDPYLADHVLDGDMLFPAVLGMEAMAQAAAALTGPSGVPALHQLELLRPIVVPAGGSTVIRVAVLVRGPGVVDAVIRSSETGFQAEHFRATLRYPRPALPTGSGSTGDAARARVPVPLDPGRDLYGEVLFQGKRFQRLSGYTQLAAKRCVAQLTCGAEGSWFGVYLPEELVLGDPGTRDAAMHSIQCCVPNATLLPLAVEQLDLADPDCRASQLTMSARERHREGDTYTYDLELRDSSGHIVERWRGLRLQAVRKKDGSGPWIPALLGPYLERQLAVLVAEPPTCVVEPDNGAGSKPRAATELALSRMFEIPVTVRHRPDGRPEVDPGTPVSSSHGAGVTFAVSGGEKVACDVEEVQERDVADWQGLLGSGQLELARLISRERGESLSASATRVWGAVECLRKIGHAAAEPIALAERGMDRWVLLRSGDVRIATFLTSLRDMAEPVVFTILTQAKG
jgi:enediyne polyketide synthase